MPEKRLGAAAWRVYTTGVGSCPSRCYPSAVPVCGGDLHSRPHHVIATGTAKGGAHIDDVVINAGSGLILL